MREFERKKLASYEVNFGVKCGHGCTYCSTGALLRMHRSFRALGLNPFDRSYAIVDPTTPERVARDARRLRKRGMVQLRTTVDGWSPEAQKHGLGRRCLEAILREPGWTVRILTKNAAVARDFDLIEQHRDRVLVGLSITATAMNENVIAAIEPNASPITERMAALWEANARGLRTYAMLCPLLPAIADTPDQIDGLVKLAVASGAEEIFCEPVNARGPGLRATQEPLEQYGRHAEAKAIAAIRKQTEWSRYVVRLVSNVQRSVRDHFDIDRLRILLYPSRLKPADKAEIRREDTGVVWLGRE
jgi:DNA repair photolyase